MPRQPAQARTSAVEPAQVLDPTLGSAAGEVGVDGQLLELDVQRLETDARLARQRERGLLDREDGAALLCRRHRELETLHDRPPGDAEGALVALHGEVA